MNERNRSASQPLSRVHELKTWPDYYNYLVDGRKQFEYRRNDRDFKVGDVLHLREWEPTFETYTGREMRREVTYVLPVSTDFVVMSLASQPLSGDADFHRKEIVRVTNALRLELPQSVAEDAQRRILEAFDAAEEKWKASVTINRGGSNHD